MHYHTRLLCRLTLIKGRPSNFCETTTTLKCVSAPLGTLCMYDSFITSRCIVSKDDASLCLMDCSMGFVKTDIILTMVFVVNAALPKRHIIPRCALK